MNNDIVTERLQGTKRFERDEGARSARYLNFSLDSYLEFYHKDFSKDSDCKIGLEVSQPTFSVRPFEDDQRSLPMICSCN